MTEVFAHYLTEVVSGRMSLDAFQDWFIGYVMGPDPVHPVDVTVAADIENALAEFTGGHIDEETFRRVLVQHVMDAPIIAYLMIDSPFADRWSSSASRTTQSEPIRVYG
jgi:hypothetical protein